MPQRAGGTTAMHIFAMAIGNGTPTMGAPYSSIAAAYDNAGISDNSDPAAADFDGTGESFSAQALAAGAPDRADRRAVRSRSAARRSRGRRRWERRTT